MLGRQHRSFVFAQQEIQKVMCICGAPAPPPQFSGLCWGLSGPAKNEKKKLFFFFVGQKPALNRAIQGVKPPFSARVLHWAFPSPVVGIVCRFSVAPRIFGASSTSSLFSGFFVGFSSCVRTIIDITKRRIFESENDESLATILESGPRTESPQVWGALQRVSPELGPHPHRLSEWWGIQNIRVQGPSR